MITTSRWRRSKTASRAGAPLIVKNKVIVGVAGGVRQQRVHRRLRSRRPESALWRFYAIPRAREPGQRHMEGRHLGARRRPDVLTGTYDRRSTALLGNGNPTPIGTATAASGQPLHRIARRARVQQRRAHSGISVHRRTTRRLGRERDPVLADLTIGGVPQGRHDGEPQRLPLRERSRHGGVPLGKPFATRRGRRRSPRTARRARAPGTDPSETGTVTCPDWYGGTNSCRVVRRREQDLFLTAPTPAPRLHPRPPPPTAVVGVENQWVAQSALVPSRIVRRAARHRSDDRRTQMGNAYEDAGWAGVLATAGGVVFSGDHEGNFFAAIRNPGKKLFQFQPAPRCCAADQYATSRACRQSSSSSGDATNEFSLPAPRSRTGIGKSVK